MRTTRGVAAALLAAWAAAAGAQARGAGLGWTGGGPPATKSSGPSGERASSLQQRPPQFDRRHGMLGAAGAAPDQQGEQRLGGFRGHASAPSYGEAARQASGGGEYAYDAWRSGDLVRSTSAADVRAARVQQAPDLEWAGAQATAATGNETYGKQFQHAQERPRR